MDEKQLAAFVQWLPTKIKELQNKTPEEIVGILNDLSKSPEGQKQLEGLVQAFKQETTGMFKKGGKINAFVEKFGKGGIQKWAKGTPNANNTEYFEVLPADTTNNVVTQAVMYRHNDRNNNSHRKLERKYPIGHPEKSSYYIYHNSRHITDEDDSDFSYPDISDKSLGDRIITRLLEFITRDKLPKYVPQTFRENYPNSFQTGGIVKVQDGINKLSAKHGEIREDDRSGLRKWFDGLVTDYRNSDFANSAVASVLAYGSPYGAWHFTVGDRKNGPDIDAARLAALPGAVGVKTAVKAAAPAAAKTATKIRIIPEGVSGLTHRQRTILNKKLADADKWEHALPAHRPFSEEYLNQFSQEAINWGLENRLK